jgi:hypothetical protein
MAKRTSVKKAALRFDQKLVLNRWMLHQFEVDDLKTLGNRIDSPDYEGFDSENRTQFYNILTSTLPFREAKLSQAQLLEYDQNIVRHWKRITESRNRTGQVLLPKYFQYLALLFVDVYLDQYFRDREGLLAALNAEVEAHNLKHGSNEADAVDVYTLADLNKLAIWCATGSGKTLLMHMNVLQYRHYLAKHGKTESPGHFRKLQLPLMRRIALRGCAE